MQRRRRRMPRLKGLSLTKLIPSMVTVAATCAGLTGVRYALEERWEFAVGAIVLAAILDALDGRMARLLKAASDFGAQLDSLSDIVAFGVAPALILYFWLLKDLSGFGWAIALFLAVCCGLRLARFNSRIDSLPPYAYNYFQGVPAPAGALLALFPMVIDFIFGAGTVPVVAVAAWTVAMALLMVCELPTFSFKKFKLPPGFILPFMALVAVAIAGLAGAPWETLAIVGVAYLITIPISVIRYAKLKAEAGELRGDKGGDDTGGDDTDGDDTDGDSGSDDGSGVTKLRPVSR